MPEASLDQQVEAFNQKVKDPSLWSQGFTIDYVKFEHGMTVYHQTYYKMAHSSTSWRVPLDKPPPASFHIIKGLKTKPLFSQKISTGDPKWDKNYKVYSEDSVLIAQFLLISGLREMLDSCITVDLRVLPQEATFLDPTNKNVMASMGGFLTRAFTGNDPSKAQTMTISVYNHISDVVLLAASIGR